MQTFASEQIHGLPIHIDATTYETAQLIHTAVSGDATPEIISIHAANVDDKEHTIHIIIQDPLTGIAHVLSRHVPVGTGPFDILKRGILLNGGCTVRAYADVDSRILVFASINDQGAQDSISPAMKPVTEAPDLPTARSLMGTTDEAVAMAIVFGG